MCHRLHYYLPRAKLYIAETINSLPKGRLALHVIFILLFALGCGEKKRPHEKEPLNRFADTTLEHFRY